MHCSQYAIRTAIIDKMNGLSICNIFTGTIYWTDIYLHEYLQDFNYICTNETLLFNTAYRSQFVPFMSDCTKMTINILYTVWCTMHLCMLLNSYYYIYSRIDMINIIVVKRWVCKSLKFQICFALYLLWSNRAVRRECEQFNVVYLVRV